MFQRWEQFQHILWCFVNAEWWMNHWQFVLMQDVTYMHRSMQRCICYYFYYCTLYFILSLTLICDALITSMFAIVYIYPYRTLLKYKSDHIRDWTWDLLHSWTGALPTELYGQCYCGVGSHICMIPKDGCECYYFYYSTLYFIWYLTLYCDVISTSMFAIIYITM